MLALYRPGPLGSGMVKDFVERKHGRRKVTYYDDRLKPILEETYGAIVYQEQVMRISMAMSGLLGSQSRQAAQGDGQEAARRARADARGVGRRRGRQRLRHQDGREACGRTSCKFAEYAFNKSHSAAYGLLTMQTAYLKAHYPLEYMAAVLTSYTGKTDKIVHYVAECNRAGYTVLPPDVNTLGPRLHAGSGEGIRFGLAGIRGVGEGSSKRSSAPARTGGAFTSLQDFCARVDMRAGQQEDARGAHQGRRVRLDRLSRASTCSR